MRWWTLPALFVCLAAGYLAGSWKADRSAGRSRRADGAHLPGDRTEPPIPAPTAAPARPDPAPSPAPDTGLALAFPDAEDPPEDWEYGILVVDFTGFDGPGWVRVESVDLDGSLDFLEEGVDDDGNSWIQLAPGEVTVRWESRGAMRRFAARARIEAGRVTRVLAADPRHVPLPEPSHLAVLDVRVKGPDGQCLTDAAVHLAGEVLEGQRWISVATDGDGGARFRVRGGSYLIQAGEREETISLDTGERRTLDLLHDATGMVVVDPVLEGIYALYPRDRGDAQMDGADFDGRAVRFLFVPPGTYDLRYRFQCPEYFGHEPHARPDDRVLATLEVRAGRAERIPHHPEPGFLEVEIGAPRDVASRRWQMRIVSERDRAEVAVDALRIDGDRLRGRTAPLEKGCYNVEILADGETVLDRYVVIGYGPTELTAHLDR